MNDIVFFHPSVDLYGADKILLQILKVVPTNKITVVLPKVGLLSEIIEKDFPDVLLKIDSRIPVIAKKYLSLKGIFRFGVKLLQLRWLLSDIVKEGDIIYLNTLAVCPILMLAHKKNRTIIHIHEIAENSSLLNRMINKFTLRYVDKIICVSNAVANNIIESCSRFAYKVNTIYNGIDKEIIDNENFYPRMDNSKVNFALVGRLKPQVKGQFLLLDALDKIDKLILQKAHFYLIGSTVDGQEFMKSQIERAISLKGLTNIVTILPFIRDMNCIYNNIDVALVPSVRPDPLPTTVLEGMMYGHPVIGTNVGGIPEMIEDNVSGFLVSPCFCEDLADKISYLISHPEEISRMGKNGENIYKKKFTLKAFSSRFENEIYNWINNDNKKGN